MTRARVSHGLPPVAGYMLAIGLLATAGSCQPEPVFSQPSSFYGGGDYVSMSPKREIDVDPEDEDCLIYTNYFQISPNESYEVFQFRGHEIILKISRGKGNEPDTLEVWDSPIIVHSVPSSLTLEELESGRMCFSWSETS